MRKRAGEEESKREGKGEERRGEERRREERRGGEGRGEEKPKNKGDARQYKGRKEAYCCRQR
eukprot:756748-Hanusia_phi.AAC.1